jgi:bacteriocin leader peptide (microcyclamide/patellamide family)
MDKKNLMPQAAQLINRTTTQEMPDVLAGIEELDEEALSQVCGGQVIPRLPPGKPPTVPSSGRGRVRGR